MIIIADARIPQEAARQLRQLGELILLPPFKVTYAAIAGHPDIYFCHTPKGLVYDPKLPGGLLEKLHNTNTPLIAGTKSVGPQYPQTALYNALATESLLIHNLYHTDPSILALYEPGCRLHINQGYTRCNALALNGDAFIVCDAGIEQALRKASKKVLLVNPEKVQLTGFKHGFFGGACGIMGDKVYLCGSLSMLDDAGLLMDFVTDSGLCIEELYQGPVIDIGSLFFVE